MNTNQPIELNEEQENRFIIGLTHYLTLRDMVITGALAPLSENDITTIVFHPENPQGDALIEKTFHHVVDSTTFTLDTERLQRAEHNIDTIYHPHGMSATEALILYRVHQNGRTKSGEGFSVSSCLHAYTRIMG